MAYKADAPARPHTTIAEAIFVFVALAIIIGGLWSLYMANAPYHPEVGMVEGEIILASD